MNSRKRQSGLTMISWIGVLAAIGVIAMIVLKLSPVYIEHFAVARSVQSVGDEKISRTPAEIRETLLKRFNVNNITSVTKNNIQIERQADRYNVGVDYQVQVPFIFNIAFVVTFSDKTVVPAP